MKIKGRTFSYPVLSVDLFDYNESTFNCEINCESQSVGAVNITVSCELNCEYIKSLILKNQAEYVLHVECSTTGFRAIYPNDLSEFSIPLNMSKVNGKVEFLILIVLKREFQNFYCDDFNDDFENNSFDLAKGSIIAFQNLPTITFKKKNKEFDNSESIFAIYRNVSTADLIMKTELDGEKIRIWLPYEQYKIYFNLNSDPNYNDIFNSIVIMPVLIYVFSELKYNIESESENIFSEYAWYIALVNRFQKSGLNLEDELDEKNAIILAQEIINNTFVNSFLQMKNIIDGDDCNEN